MRTTPSWGNTLPFNGAHRSSYQLSAVPHSAQHQRLHHHPDDARSISLTIQCLLVVALERHFPGQARPSIAELAGRPGGSLHREHSSTTWIHPPPSFSAQHDPHKLGKPLVYLAQRCVWAAISNSMFLVGQPTQRGEGSSDKTKRTAAKPSIALAPGASPVRSAFHASSAVAHRPRDCPGKCCLFPLPLHGRSQR